MHYKSPVRNDIDYSWWSGRVSTFSRGCYWSLSPVEKSSCGPEIFPTVVTAVIIAAPSLKLYSIRWVKPLEVLPSFFPEFLVKIESETGWEHFLKPCSGPSSRKLPVTQLNRLDPTEWKIGDQVRSRHKPEGWILKTYSTIPEVFVLDSDSFNDCSLALLGSKVQIAWNFRNHVSQSGRMVYDMNSAISHEKCTMRVNHGRSSLFYTVVNVATRESR